MNSKKAPEKYIVFLRGINVSGHHKIPMADLRMELENLGFYNVVTLLNSGNIILNSKNQNTNCLEELIESKLERTFGFPVPTIIRNAETIHQLFNSNPFKDVAITKDIRLYVSFLKKNTQVNLRLPWSSHDNSYKIIERKNGIILSILDLSVSKTPKAMEALEKFFGKEITTRNWKTIERIVKKL